MRKFLLLFFISAMTFSQETTVDFTMGSGYPNEVYFDFSENQLESFNKEIWDLAFERTSMIALGVRVNDGKGLSVHEVSDNPSDWDSIDSTAEGNELYNSETNWSVGAFNYGSATYGWGEYNPTTHHVNGTIIYLIKSQSNTTYKFIIEDLFYGYTIKYALWNNATSSWGDDQTAVIPNTTNEGHLFNFFSLGTGEIVEASPALDQWDMVFKKYIGDLGGGTLYTVTGTLTNPNVTVAQVEEATSAGWTDTDNLTFAEEINTIGYDWKSFSSGSYVIVPNRVYYVKANDIIYRMYFTSFDGGATGNGSFVYEPQNMSTVDAEGNVQFAVYPNPVKNNQITLVYDNAKAQSNNAVVEIYNTFGQQVFSTKLNNASGLFQRNIQLNNLAKGVYILKFVQGNDMKTEKLLIQ